MSTQDLLFTLILSSAWCIGFHAFIKKVVFAEIIGYEIEDKWEAYPWYLKVLMKPLFACPYCMASIHGTIIFFAFVLGYLPLIMWVPFCICLCGLNYFLTQFFTE